MRFTEIEHKFIVGESFDLARFRAQMEALGPTRSVTLRVRDRYFLTDHSRGNRYVIRHRYDEELQHLTIKALEADPEVRNEINLDLGQHVGNQTATVDAFAERLGATWSGDIVKDIEVWHFPACEVVHYTAFTRDRTVACVEFEAINQSSVEAALAVLDSFERATGFAQLERSRSSLVELLYPGVLA